MQLTNLCLRLSWVTLTRCSPWVSLNSLPSFLPPSTPTLQARPSLNIKIFHWRSLFINVCLPVFKPNLVYCPAPSRCDFCHTISFLCLVLSFQHFLVCHFIHGNPLLYLLMQAHKVSIHANWMGYLSISWYQQLWEHCSQTCEQYTWGQSPSPTRNKERGKFQGDTFEVFALLLNCPILKK